MASPADRRPAQRPGDGQSAGTVGRAGASTPQRVRGTVSGAAHASSSSSAGRADVRRRPSTAADDPYGRRVFFNGIPASGRGHFAVCCSRCGAVRRMTLPAVVRAHLPFSFWVPVMSNSHYMLCPSCRQRSWVKLSFNLGTAAPGSPR